MHKGSKAAVANSARKIVTGVAEAAQIFLRQVHAPTLDVLLQVAQDVGQLKSDAQLRGRLDSGGIAESPNVNARQAHNRRDLKAISFELGKSFVRALGLVHFHAVDRLEKIVAGMA